MSQARKSQEVWTAISAEWEKPEEAAKVEFIQYYKPFFYAMEEFMPKEKGMKVLEAGCGTATHTAYMAHEWGARGICLDFVPEMMKLAKEKFLAAGVEGDFVVGDMRRLPFKDGAFNMVFNQGTIEHFPKHERQVILDEMCRVSGKYVAIFVPNMLNPIRAVAKRVQKLTGRWIWGLELPFSQFELERRLKRAGMTVTKKAGVNFYKIYYTYWPFRLFLYPALRRILGERIFRMNAGDDLLNTYFGDEIFQLAVKNGKAG